MFTTELKEKVKKVFPAKQARVLEEVIELVDETVKTKDFNELKAIVADLAHAQKRTEQRVEELAEAQKRTEQRVEELAEAQKRTEEEVRKLAIGLKDTRGELGELSRTLSYAFENEAFKHLPTILKSKFEIEITERFIRQEIRKKEINLFARGKRNGIDVIIVGESKLRLADRKELREVFDDIEGKAKAVREEYGDIEIIKLVITHYATKGALKMAEERGVIVIQSFEW